MKKLLVFVPLLLIYTRSLACSIVSQSDDPISLIDEQTLIVWNESEKLEHFIRTAHFDNGNAEIGFIVPLPSVPEIADFPDEIFKDLHQEIEKQRPVEYEFFTKKSEINESLGGAAVPGSRSTEVRIHREFDLESYKAKVIEAKSLRPLQDWLREHSFILRPALSRFLESYLKRGYVFAVFNYRGTTSEGTRSKTVRITFKTDKPFYPYSEPLEENGSNGPRSLNLFILASTQLGPEFYPDGFERTPYFSHEVMTPAPLDTILHGKKKLWLTSWRDSTLRRPQRDLEFKEMPREKVLLPAQTKQMFVYLLLIPLVFIPAFYFSISKFQHKAFLFITLLIALFWLFTKHTLEGAFLAAFTESVLSLTGLCYVGKMAFVRRRK